MANVPPNSSSWGPDSSLASRFSRDVTDVSEKNISEGKKIMAAKVASTVPGGGAPARVISAFIQVKDYAGLEKYLTKHQVPTDILTTALQNACINSDSRAVEIFAEHGANINYVDQFGTTMLHYAIRGGGDECIIQSLVSHGLDFSGWQTEGMPLLHWACSVGYLQLVTHMVDHLSTHLHEADKSGRLPIHVAAVYGQTEVLSYLITAFAKQLRPMNVPQKFMAALADCEEENSDEAGHGENHRSSLTAETVATRMRKSFKGIKLNQAFQSQQQVDSARKAAASNYLDIHQWTPFHHASCEEATNNYQECLRLLLDNGADPMLPTLQGKTALDLAYGAGRSQVLVDVLPKRQLIALLIRIDDIVPANIRMKNMRKHAQKRPSFSDSSLFKEHYSGTTLTPVIKEDDYSRDPSNERTRKGYSFIRRLAENLDTTNLNVTEGGMPKFCGDVHQSEMTNVMSVWRKILLNDNVELLETLRDSQVWRRQSAELPPEESNFLTWGKSLPYSVEHSNATDFEAAQRLTSRQMAELFSDCYENGTGVYSHVQSKYQEFLKNGDFLTVLRDMTGLLTFNPLVTNKVVILRPMYKSLLFLAIICGRFRVTEQLLRMRQFDILPAAVLVILICRRLRKEPSFPQQVISELDRLTDRFEAIAVDALTLTFLKDNTPEKRICQNLLSVPLTGFGNLAFLDLCARGNCNNLLSLPCCQWLLDERWHGVLKSVPTTVRLAARVFPLTAVAYLEYRARQEARTSSVKLKATEGILGARRPLPPGKSQDLNLQCLPIQPGKPLRGKYNTHADNNIDKRIKQMGRLTTTTSFNQNSDCLVTVYDRMMFQYGWNSMPRWNFFLGIWKSPSMKFYLYSLFHLIFLLLFSFVCVYNLHIRITVVEWISLAYVVGYAVEEIRQVVVKCVLGEFREYLTDFWNWIDIVSIGFTGVGFVVRMTVNRSFTSLNAEAYDSRMYLARNLYLVALNLFFMRTLFITSISQIIGPRLKMMADMIRKDLMPLLIVFFIFILSYGVWMQALLHPNSYYEVPDKGDPRNFIRSDMQRLKLSNSLGDLFKRAFYSIFEVTVVTEEEVCKKGDDACGHREGYEIVIYFVLVIYACIVNIILINLLIALFSNTVSRIDQKAKALWLAGRYKMVKEYRERTPLPPPFNVMCIVYEAAVFLFSRFKKCACKAPCRRCFKKPSSVYATIAVNWSEKWDPMNGSSSEEGDDENALNWAAPAQEPRVMHLKTMDSKRLEEVTEGNQATETSVKRRELDALLKFILLQSFSLQDHRYILGSGMSGSSLLNVPTERSTMLSNFFSESPDEEHDMKLTLTQVKKRLDNIEVILDRMLSQFEDKQAPVTAKITSTSPTLSPRPLKIPISSTTFSSACNDRESVHVPTSQELAGEVLICLRRSKLTSKPTF